MKHFNSSRFVVIFGITLLTLSTLVILAFIGKDIAIAATGPAFIALGILWGTIGASKMIEHNKSLTNTRNEDVRT